MNNTDVIRELAKARDALEAARTHLARHAEALEGVAAVLAAIPAESGYTESSSPLLDATETPPADPDVRHPGEYMRPRLTPWTREEREHIERVNSAMTDGWSDAYREQPPGGDHG